MLTMVAGVGLFTTTLSESIIVPPTTVLPVLKRLSSKLYEIAVIS